ncbi:membrane bound O-acyl transferase MBOAT family protein [Candidatus Omnitrophus magneticus]|uniref:Membrane bound O-acyl transferase MBOAT family protein n=1 Tax=Candidatus Omnitrophus magneticus TaxID=1609969 RepID=A0A0F0CV52_9BACT|nr:membrane bound O-acyl transferase MBOAT family protein [Candidatus Omnitrophus magneticus]
MLFNSFQFMIFLPFVVCLFFAIPHRYRWILLLAASYYFYMCWKAEYILLILFSTAIDYFVALKISQLPDSNKKGRKKYLFLSLLTNFGLLFAFKYANFFNESTRAVFNHFNIFYNVPVFKLLLPVGISFYTFQTVSYVIDVYRGNQKAEKHFGIFALFVTFFPQLVAGPIERSTNLLSQFYKKMEPNPQHITDGLIRVLWGMFKKVVIADRLAIYIERIYSNVDLYPAPTLILATYFFAFQIYCDFSGYSDIAIGSAKMMGFDLMENFQRPYFSTSIAEFWKRWHISLSTWFRDYLYIPLGGNRVKTKWRWYFNLFTVFAVSGLWHGANWTFVIWGALHGFYLVFSIITAKFRERVANVIGLTQFPFIRKIIQIFITFHLVCFGWIFFRANSVRDAHVVISKIFSLNWGKFAEDSQKTLGYAFFGLSILILIEIFQNNRALPEFIQKNNLALRWGFYVFCATIILLMGVFDGGQFIYFQF